MSKKTIKKSTMFNLKGILILLAFGIWVNLIMEIEDDFGSIKEMILTYGGNTLMVITVTYIIMVVFGLFFEAQDID